MSLRAAYHYLDETLFLWGRSRSERKARHKARGQGIAGRMFDVVEDEARRRGCVKLTLEVLTGNKGAMQAYACSGFAPNQLDPEMGEARFWHKKL